MRIFEIIDYEFKVCFRKRDTSNRFETSYIYVFWFTDENMIVKIGTNDTFKVEIPKKNVIFYVFHITSMNIGLREKRFRQKL